MKTKIIFLVLLTLPLLAYSQTIQKISGRVFGNNETLTEGYNVVLLLPKDSSIYKGDYFLGPDYSIETSQMPILLMVSSFGYIDTTLLIQSTAEKVPDIWLTAKNYSLDEIVVRPSIPMFSVKSDRTTLGVAGTILSSAGSALDLLQKAARVKVDEAGASILGVGSALILVDGRELPTIQTLEMLSSSEIQKVDIITNPSAKYDAKGKAVIEIITKRAKNNGFGAELTGRINKGDYWNQYVGTEITAKNSKLALYTFYAFSPTKKSGQELYKRDYTKEIPPIYGLIGMESLNKTDKNHRARLSVDYNFSKKHMVGLQFSGQFLGGKNSLDELSQLYNSSNTSLAPISKITTTQKTLFNKNYLTGTVFYTYQPSSKGVNINVVVDKSRYDTNQNANIEEYGNSGVVLKQNNLKATINISSFKVDVIIPTPKGYRLETGIKYSNICNQSNTNFSSNKATIRDVHYNYKENIGALYFIVSKPVGRFNSQLGARLELSDNYATTDIIVQNNRQWNIFPSLNLNYNIAKNWDTNLSYATKISRPTFQDLNPAIDYIDSLTYFQGNPALIPEISQTATLKFIYRKMASLGLSYTQKNDLLAWYIEQDPNNSAISKVTQKNIDKSDVISVDLTLPYQNKWVSYYLSTGLIYTISNDAASGVNNLNQPMWYAYSGFDFSLPYGFKANVNIRYFTKGIENVFYFDPVFRMDIGIRKSFIKDKITATILWNDIFKTDNMNTYTTINNRYIGYNYYFDRSAVSLSISYRFSAQKSKYQSRSSIGAESQRIKNLN